MHEAMKQAIDRAYRAIEFDEKLHQEGFIRWGYCSSRRNSQHRKK